MSLRYSITIIDVMETESLKIMITLTANSGAGVISVSLDFLKEIDPVIGVAFGIFLVFIIAVIAVSLIDKSQKKGRQQSGNDSGGNLMKKVGSPDSESQPNHFVHNEASAKSSKEKSKKNKTPFWKRWWQHNNDLPEEKFISNLRSVIKKSDDYDGQQSLS